MLKFLKNIFAFLIIALVLGEFIIRVTHSVSDIPHRQIDEFGIQKYAPNQTGFWVGGDHKWSINKLGWPGNLTPDFNNLISIIGDSYIENFMNPNECRQAVLLKEKLDLYNFFEAGRSGVSFIEAMEISKSIDSLKPKLNLIYLSSNDFYESIREIRQRPSITQWSVETNKIIVGRIKSPGSKKILYNWKLMYYFYNNFYTEPSEDEKSTINDMPTMSDEIKSEDEILQLLKYVKNNYDINNKVLVFYPKTNYNLIQLCRDEGFSVICLNSKDYESWSFEHDKHWTCFGHRKAAEQVSEFLENKKLRALYE